MLPLLAVDYGTSHTVAMLRRADGQVRPLLFGSSPLLPSGVYAGEDGLRCGTAAQQRALADPGRFEPYPKRRVDDGEVLLGERSWPVAELFAATLRNVRGEAERTIGGRVGHVVLTHPANWGNHRRAVLADAAARAGLGDVSFVTEPVAAARYHLSAPHLAAGAHIAVYDLGAGTCDVTIMRGTGAGFDVAATGGLDDVGGADIDELLLQRVLELVPAERSHAWREAAVADRRQLRQLREAIRLAKETLSTSAQAELSVPGLDRDLHLTRAELESVATEPLRRTIKLTSETIAASGAPPVGLYLVGGSSRMPVVATMLHREIGIPPIVVDQPELVVAEGALLPAEPAAPPTPAPQVPAAPQPSPAAPVTPPPPTVPPQPFHARVDLDFRKQRVRFWTTAGILTFLVLAFGIVFSSSRLAAGDGSGVVLPLVVVLLWFIIVAIWYFFKVPYSREILEIAVDDSGIIAATGANTVDLDWHEIRAATLFGDHTLIIEALRPGQFEVFHGWGVDSDSQFIRIGPIDPIHMDELHDALEAFAGPRHAPQ